MSTILFSVLIGLVIGALWAFEGIGGAVVAAVLAAIGGGVGWLVAHGTVDVRAIIGRRDED